VKVSKESCVIIAAIIFCGVGVTQFSVAQEKVKPFNVVEATIPEIHAEMKAGRLTVHKLVQDYLDRIAAYDHTGPNINCIVTMNADALAEADKLDVEFKKTGQMAGSLYGIPILVKDEIDAAGMPTTLGSAVFKDYRPTLDSFVVAQLRKQGAIVLGKTTLSEFAAGDTYGSSFAEPGEAFGKTRNPYDPTRTVGGSSGGSGACLAANFSTATIGEETYASIRRPGSWNDVVSMRPTSGLVSRTGMYDGWPAEPASPGPMARTVGDLARLMDVMTGYDPEDPETALGYGHKPASYVAGLDKNALKGARIGVLRTDIGINTDPTEQDYKEIMTSFSRTVTELKAAGAIVVDPIEIPGLVELQKKRAGRSDISELALEAWLARNPNSPFHNRADIGRSPDMDKVFPPTKVASFTRAPQPPDLQKYADYLVARQELMINLLKVMADNKLDAIVYRTVEHSPTLISEGTKPPYPTNKGVPILNTFLVYVPVITVPSGFTPENLPTGVTFMGGPYSDAKMISLAYAYEQATHHRVPPTSTPPLPATSSMAAAAYR
jgi:amidase